MTQNDPNQLVELVSLPSDLEAELLVARLKEAGIEAVPFSTAHDATGFLSTAMPHGGVGVNVRRRDFDRAKAIVAEFESETPEAADWMDDDGDDEAT